MGEGAHGEPGLQEQPAPDSKDSLKDRFPAAFVASGVPAPGTLTLTYSYSVRKVRKKGRGGERRDEEMGGEKRKGKGKGEEGKEREQNPHKAELVSICRSGVFLYFSCLLYWPLALSQNSRRQ